MWNLLDFVDLDLWGYRDCSWGWLLNWWTITESGAWQSHVGPQTPGTHSLLSLTWTSGDFRLSGVVFLLEWFTVSVLSSGFVALGFIVETILSVGHVLLWEHWRAFVALPLEDCYCVVKMTQAWGWDSPSFKPGHCRIFSGKSSLS